MKYFSDCLAKLIKDKGITQKELYTELNLGRNQLHFWVIGKAEPDLESLKKIAQYFDVTIDFLLGLEDEFGGKV